MFGEMTKYLRRSEQKPVVQAMTGDSNKSSRLTSKQISVFFPPLCDFEQNLNDVKAKLVPFWLFNYSVIEQTLNRLVRTFFSVFLFFWSGDFSHFPPSHHEDKRFAVYDSQDLFSEDLSKRTWNKTNTEIVVSFSCFLWIWELGKFKGKNWAL